MFYSYIFDNIFIEDAMPEKALRCALHEKIFKIKFSFLNIFQKFL